MTEQEKIDLVEGVLGRDSAVVNKTLGPDDTALLFELVRELARQVKMLSGSTSQIAEIVKKNDSRATRRLDSFDRTVSDSAFLLKTCKKYGTRAMKKRLAELLYLDGV